MKTIHATAVLLGACAVLVRGPSGSGKSALALRLIGMPPQPGVPLARLVADDRVVPQVVHGRLLVRPPAELAGLLEVRGLGLIRVPHEPSAVAAWIVDLGIPDAPRLPPPVDTAEIGGVMLPRLALPPGADALATVLAGLPWRL